jgi:hypothetical protein
MWLHLQVSQTFLYEMLRVSLKFSGAGVWNQAADLHKYPTEDDFSPRLLVFNDTCEILWISTIF